MPIRNGTRRSRSYACPFPTMHLETIKQVIRVTCKKALLLDEIKKHQTVQHERGIPLTITPISNTPYTEEKLAVLLLEEQIEFFRDLLHIRGIKLVYRDKSCTCL
jgi:hypothetical protein